MHRHSGLDTGIQPPGKTNNGFPLTREWRKIAVATFRLQNYQTASPAAGDGIAALYQTLLKIGNCFKWHDLVFHKYFLFPLVYNEEFNKHLVLEFDWQVMVLIQALSLNPVRQHLFWPAPDTRFPNPGPRSSPEAERLNASLFSRAGFSASDITWT